MQEPLGHVVPHLGSASQTYSTCAGVGGGRLDRRQRHALPRDAVNREGAPAARDHQSTFLRELFLISLQRPKDLLKLHHRLIHGRADEDIDVSRWTLYSPLLLTIMAVIPKNELGRAAGQ